MDILVVDSGDSVRAERFAQHARENGYRVQRSTPGQRMPGSDEPWLGLVCFGPRVSSTALQLLTEDVLN